MIDALGPYAGYIVTCYAIAAVTIAALIGWVMVEHASLTRRLKDMEARGIRRRSARPAATGTDQAEAQS